MNVPMDLLIGAVMATPVVAPVVARRLYGVWRADKIDEWSDEIKDDYCNRPDHRFITDPEARLEKARQRADSSRNEQIVGALLAGLLWEVVLAGYLLWWVGHLVTRVLFDTVTTRSRLELEVEAARGERALAERDARIAELEKTELMRGNEND